MRQLFVKTQTWLLEHILSMFHQIWNLGNILSCGFGHLTAQQITIQPVSKLLSPIMHKQEKQLWLAEAKPIFRCHVTQVRLQTVKLAV
jgi:hypothetical protein